MSPTPKADIPIPFIREGMPHRTATIPLFDVDFLITFLLFLKTGPQWR